MKRQYDENGFIAIPNFLSKAELEHWRTVTDDAVKQRLKKRNGFSNQSDPEAYYANVFVQCVKLADSHSGMRKIMFDEKLGQVAAELAGVDGIRIWHDQALFKPPYGNPTGWHLDNPYWSFSSRQAISIWVALDDATLANGCLWYLPGTHKLARWENSGIGENIGSLFKIYPEWRKIAAVPAAGKSRHGRVSQRHGGSRRWREHDQRPAPRDDLRLHARWQHVQRHEQRVA